LHGEHVEFESYPLVFCVEFGLKVHLSKSRLFGVNVNEIFLENAENPLL